MKVFGKSPDFYITGGIHIGTGELILFLILFLFSLKPLQAQPEDLDVIKNWMEYTDASNSLYHNLGSQIYSQLEKRSSEISTITTLAQWQERHSFHPTSLPS